MNENNCMPVRRALISVSDKTGAVAFASRLAALGVEILSTGGTAQHGKETKEHGDLNQHR